MQSDDMHLKRKANLLQILFFIHCLFICFLSQRKDLRDVFYAQFVVMPTWLAALLALHLGFLITVASLTFIVRRRSFQIHTGYGTFGPTATLIIGFVAMVIGLYVTYYFQLLDTLQGVFALVESTMTILVLSFKLRENPESVQ